MDSTLWYVAVIHRWCEVSYGRDVYTAVWSYSNIIYACVAAFMSTGKDFNQDSSITDIPACMGCIFQDIQTEW